MSESTSPVKRFYRSHPIIANIILIMVTAMILLWLALIFLDCWTHHGDTSTVPQVKGMSFAQATQVLKDNNLGIEISDSIYDRNAAPGTVIETSPKAGATVKKDRQIYVTITAFSPKLVTISAPVIGVSSRQAISYLNALGINSIRIVNVPSQYPDLVENAYYGSSKLNVGTKFPVTSTVTLEIGSAPVAVEPVDSLDYAIDNAIDSIVLDENF